MNRLLDSEVAERLRICTRTLRRLVNRTPPGASRPWVVVGRSRRWVDDDAEITAWLRSLEPDDAPVKRRGHRGQVVKYRSTPAELRRKWAEG